MVTGFTKFKEKFQGFEDQYVVIGGTACDLLMEKEDMTFRATSFHCRDQQRSHRARYI